MKRAVIALAVIAALAGGAAAVLRGGGARADAIATYAVARERFERRVTAEGNLRAVKATKLTPPPNTSGRFGPVKIAWLAPDGVLVKQGDVVVRFDPSEPEKQLRDGQTDLASASAKLRQETVKSSAAVADRDADAALARDELDRTRKFQSRDQMIFSRNQIIESEIDEHLADARQANAETTKQIERRLSHSNVAVIDVERQKAALAISHAQAALHGMELVAPSDGIFVLERDRRGNVPQPGDSLWPSQAVAEIPILDEMEASVYVLEVDGSGLAEGQPARVVVEAQPDRVFDGKIRIVDKLAQPRQHGSPVQYFGVTIQLAATDRAVMKPGQRVRATLLLDQADALVVPRQAVIERDGKRVVYRRAPGATAGFEPIAVELGPATSGRVVIAGGLAAGDVIALRDPTRAAEPAGEGSGSAAPERAP